MIILLDLFLTFAKVGLFTFGGGYAMIALIQNACVEKKQWMWDEGFLVPGTLNSWKRSPGACGHWEKS